MINSEGGYSHLGVSSVDVMPTVDMQDFSGQASGWETDFGIQVESFDEKLALEPPTYLPTPSVKIEDMQHFSAVRRQQQAELPSATSQTTLLKNIAKQRSAHRGSRSAPYANVQSSNIPAETESIPGVGGVQLKMERKHRKNTREKQRRQELNEKFDTLCNLLHLGRKTKAEKFTILSEAINLINSLRRENTALRKEKTKLYRLLNRVPPASTGIESASPSSPTHLPTSSPSRPTSVRSTSTSSLSLIEPDDEDYEPKMKFKVTDSEDHSDPPRLSLNNNYLSNGYTLKEGKGGRLPMSSSEPVYGAPPLDPLHLSLPSGQSTEVSPIFPQSIDLFDMPSSLPRRLSPTSARLDSPPLSTQLPSPLRSPFGRISSPSIDSTSQMTF
jgi:hypothetical protein